MLRMTWVVAMEVGWHWTAGMMAVAADIVAYPSAPVGHHK